MNVRHVKLSRSEREELGFLLQGGTQAVRKLKRAQILLAADAGMSDDDITTSVGVGGSTVYRTRRRFVEGGLAAALSEEPRPGAERKLTGKEEALPVATACSSPPAGRARWTLELLADEMVKFTEYVARMEDVLDLYAEAPDPRQPVVCFDESPIQLIGEVRPLIPAKPGQIERYGYEYRRNGTANLFVVIDVNRPWRKVKVTEHRAATDFAVCMREPVDVHYPKADRIRVLLDNLSTHKAGALYQAFPAPEARRLLRRLEFHYTPKHASCSTWSRSRSASSHSNALTAASTATPSSLPRPPHGKNAVTPSALASTGCSQPRMRGPNCDAHIPKSSKQPPKNKES
jgi:transposase